MSIMKNISFIASVLVVLLAAGSSHAYTLDSCSISCHAALRDLRLSHQPVVEKKCLDCHKQVGNHPLGKESMTLVQPQPTLCFGCHGSFPEKKVVHPPVRKGTCTACHNPHGAPGKYLIDADNGQTKFCTGCHDAGMFTKKNVHPPVAEGKCTACHDPHQSDEKSLLLGGGVPKLCLKCHPDVMKKLESAAFVHPPVKQGRCTGCHDPHSSSARYLLKGEPEKFCTSCHTAIGKTVADAVFQHAPVKKPASCLSCHSGHTAKAKSLLPAGGKDFCLGCHTNIAQTLEGKKSVHGPIKAGKCVPCHDPHGSPYKKLLKGTYPDNLYVPYDKEKKQYAFCLKCHEKYLLAFPDTSFYTKFRNGKQNLHYVHVANKRKGRTCRLCHEPHASTNDHMLRKDGAEFGEWNIPLGFVPTPNGGSCLPGCHGRFAYDRNRKVDNSTH